MVRVGLVAPGVLACVAGALALGGSLKPGIALLVALLALVDWITVFILGKSVERTMRGTARLAGEVRALREAESRHHYGLDQSLRAMSKRLDETAQLLSRTTHLAARAAERGSNSDDLDGGDSGSQAEAAAALEAYFMRLLRGSGPVQSAEQQMEADRGRDD